MLMGDYLLSEMNIQLEGLDHQNFALARELVEQKSDNYAFRAERLIEEELQPLFSAPEERTLQRLSATFRRADLIDLLLKAREGDKA